MKCILCEEPSSCDVCYECAYHYGAYLVEIVAGYDRPLTIEAVNPVRAWERDEAECALEFMKVEPPPTDEDTSPIAAQVVHDGTCAVENCYQLAGHGLRGMYCEKHAEKARRFGGGK